MMKKVLNELKQKISTVLKSFSQKVRHVWAKVIDFYNQKIDPFIQKAGRFLTHNPILRFTNTHIIFFSLIKIKQTNKRREHFFGYLFIALWVIGFLVFTLYPMFFSLYLTTQKAYFNLSTGITTSPNGLRNYQMVLSDSRLLPLYAAYLQKIFISVILIIVFSILIAILVNQPIKGKGLWRTIFFLPVVITTGPVISELISQNATSIPSLTQSNIASFIINNTAEIIANPLVSLFNSLLLVLWYAGIPILVMLAGLQKIDKGLYEAASIDGASPWDCFWKITLPSIRPLISVNIVYVVVSMSLYVETGGLLDLAKVHMAQGAPDSLLWLGYGYAATIAWIYFFLMVILIAIFVLFSSVKNRSRG